MADRKLPVRVHRGGLSGKYFAITNYRVIDAERDLIEARTKHDVTVDVEAHIANRTQELEAEVARLQGLERVARAVADYWREGGVRQIRDGDSLGALISHPCSCILAALDGETDPSQLGVEPESVHARAIVTGERIGDAEIDRG